MAINYYNAELGVEDINGNKDIIYPVTKSINIDCTNKSYIIGGESVKDLQSVLDQISTACNGSIKSTGGLMINETENRALEIQQRNESGDNAFTVFDYGNKTTMYIQKNGSSGSALLLFSNTPTNDHIVNINAMENSKGLALFVDSSERTAESNLIYFRNKTNGKSNTLYVENCKSSSATIYSQAKSSFLCGVITNGLVQSVAHTVPSSRKTVTVSGSITDNEAKNLLYVNTVKYKYNEYFGGIPNQVGLLAEEIMGLLPGVVFGSEEYNEGNFEEGKGFNQSMLSVDYGKIVPYLIKLCQVQNQEIEELRTQINELRALIH